MADGSQVYVVLDHEYGERVVDLARSGPVWIVDTPSNRQAVINCDRPKDAFDVTLFKPSEGGLSNSNSIDRDLIERIAYRQWEASYPSCRCLQVVGATLDEPLKERLRQFGFGRLESTVNGFSAARGDVVPDEATALACAKQHFALAFGQEEVQRFHRFDVTLKEDNWIIQATPEADSMNDPAQLRIRINKADGSAGEIWRSFSITQ